MQDCGGIKSAAYPQSKGNVSDKVLGYGGPHQAIEFLHRLFERAFAWGEVHLPERLLTNYAISPFQPMPGSNFADSLY